jgi:hypothetical protein
VKAQTRKMVDEVSGPAHAGDSSGVDALATLKASNRRSLNLVGVVALVIALWAVSPSYGPYIISRIQSL